MSNDIDWPDALERTPADAREGYPGGFRVTRTKAITNILNELERWDGVTDVQLETAANHTKKNPNRPYANATPDDPGVLVRFVKDGEDMAAGCDQWDNLRDNSQDLYHYLHETRMQEQRGAVTAESEYSKLRLPSGNPHAVADPYNVLGVDRDADEETIANRARERLKETHPDRGGDVDEFQRVKQAREELVG